MEEQELLARCKNGDDAAMEQMLNRYKNMVRSRAMTLFLVGADKEDLIQEGMIGLFKAIREYDPERNDSFSAFARLCVMRQMYSAIKASQTKKNSPLNNYVPFESLTEPEDARTGKGMEQLSGFQKNPEDFVINRERNLFLESRLMEVLSSFEKKVLSLYSEGTSYQRMAEVLGKDQKSIDNALWRIRKKLKTVLAIT